MNQKRLILTGIVLIFVGIPAFGLLNSFIYKQKQGTATRDMVAPSTMTADFDGTVEQVAVGRSTILPMPPTYPGDSGFVPGEDRTILKTASLGLVVENTRTAVDSVAQITKEANGLVSSSNIYENEYQKGAVRAEMVLRVPVDKLEDTVSKLRKLALKVLQDSVNAEDRTKQKVDLEARIKNLRASEEQLLLIMRQAKNVQETLEVQRQLTEVRGQIEVMTAQLENLTGDAAMSTVTVSLTTEAADLPTVSPQQSSIFQEIKLAFKDMIRVYRNLFIAGLRTVIMLLPLIIIGVIAWFVWKRKAKKS